MADWHVYSKKRHFVYLLGDPRTMQVRYVGCTTNVAERFRGHLKGQSARKVKAWVAELVSLGLKPSMRVIQECGRWWSGRASEQKWIAHFWERDPSVLLNSHNNAITREVVAEMRAKQQVRRQRIHDRRVLRRSLRTILVGTRCPSKSHRGKGGPPRYFEFAGELLNMSQWARRCGVSKERIRQRLLKYPPEKAIGDYLS